jgi:hypothetical protein
VEQSYGAEQQAIEIAVQAGARWMVNGLATAEFDGIFDVDLQATPTTNILPIRRLELKPGGSAQVSAVWLRMPEFKVEVLRQRYTRLERNRYQYESATGFNTEILVDDLGLVISYPGGWEREAGWTAAETDKPGS